MKKKLRTKTFAIVISTLAITTVLATSVQASTGRNLNKSYYETKCEKMIKIYYDYGTTKWFDDVTASTEADCTYGMTTRAQVELTGRNGGWQASCKTEKNTDGYVHSGNAWISGEDYGKRVIHKMYRKNNTDKKWTKTITYDYTHKGK